METVRSAQAGNKVAYAALLRRWAAPVMAICRVRVGREAAEDLAQEALLRGFRALGDLRQPEKFGPWLCNIARRVCLDWQKAKARSVHSFSSLGLGAGSLPAAAVGPEGQVQRREEVGELLREVDALPEHLREVIVSYYYDDVTYRELAERLGVSTATVNLRLTQARKLLRERLGAGR